MNMNDKALNAYNMMEKTWGVNDRITLEKFKIYAANNEEKNFQRD